MHELPFGNYWLGTSFEGLELSGVWRECGTDGDPNAIRYFYGDCTPRGGGCGLPLEVHVGAPGSIYSDGFAVHYPDATVVIVGGEPAKGRIAGLLVEAPRRPILLAREGVFFDEECLREIHGCHADGSLQKHGFGTVLWVLWIPFFWVAPFIAALVLGRLWLLLVPVVQWWLLYMAGSAGLFATGESWEYWIIPMMLLGVATVALGLGLRWLRLKVRGRRVVGP